MLGKTSLVSGKIDSCRFLAVVCAAIADMVPATNGVPALIKNCGKVKGTAVSGLACSKAFVFAAAKLKAAKPAAPGTVPFFAPCRKSPVCTKSPVSLFLTKSCSICCDVKAL